MLSDYIPLQLHALVPEANLIPTDLQNRRHLKTNHPALDVMTDLHSTPAITISPDTGIEDAEAHMRRRGVRLLFVLDSEYTLSGLITASDLLGEKPLQFIERHGGKHSDIRVRDIMTPREQLEVLKLTDVRAARVGHIVATLQHCGRQHALVVETIDGCEQICGLFSASRIARQLDMEIITTPIAQTFSEIKQALVR